MIFKALSAGNMVIRLLIFLVFIDLVNPFSIARSGYGKFLADIPEEHMNVSQIIKYHGYPCEIHEVVTADGYILSLQRIPHGKKQVPRKNKVVFLQHGLIDSAATWVNNLPEESLGFVLADQGYEVWLGNSRGNTYSNRHIHLSVDDDKFWDFSFDEMAKYDLPASIKYALNVSRAQDLYYVGHSQGTTIGFIEFSRNQDLGAKVKTFFALAPVATVTNIKGALKVLSYMAPEVEFLIKLLGVKDFAPNNWLMKFLADVLCAFHVMENVCGNILFMMTGFDISNLNETRLPVYISHTPAGTSSKDVIHFTQMIKSGKFQMYDYGKEGNERRYGVPLPPVYNVSSMKTPVALFSGTNDWLADPTDINESLRPYLKNIIHDQTVDGWNHMDFVWGEDAHSLIYAEMIDLMK